MKVLLVKPYNLSDHIQPSLGLGYLAAAIRNRHKIRILDCIKENMPPSKLIGWIEHYKPDVVGIQCYTFDLKNVNEILEGIKQALPKTITVLGGPHPSADPQGTMERFKETLDFAFIGEAEQGFAKLLDMLEGSTSKELNAVEGLIWKEGSKVNVNNAYLEDELDKFGFPAWDLIKPQDYPPAQHGAFFKKFPIAPIIITRGCPFSCSFCAGNLVSGKKIRRHSIEYVLKEISMLYKEYGIKEFHIIDDNFTMNKEFAKDLLRGILGLGLDISWATPNGIRMETLDDELLELMKKSGLYLISLGIESGSDRILKAMCKNTSVQLITDTVKRIRLHNIPIAAFFILGYIDETEKEMEETIQLSLRLDLIRANYFNFLPFPGTTSYKEILGKEGIEKIDFEKFYFMDVAYTPKGVSAKLLRAMQRKAFMRFYLRPNILIENLREIKSLRHFKFLAKRFFHWIIGR